jgi:hypothetical protein
MDHRRQPFVPHPADDYADLPDGVGVVWNNVKAAHTTTFIRKIIVQVATTD